MAFCRICGSKLDEDSNYCENCGAKVVSTESAVHESMTFCKYCGKPTTLDGICADCLTRNERFNRSNASNNTAQTPQWVCPKCGVLISEIICPYCGNMYNPFDREIPVERNKGLAIAGFVCGLIGLFILPIIFSPLSLIFGIIALAANPREKGEGYKAIWKYKNKARGFGLSATIVGAIGIIYMIIRFFILLYE